MSVHVKVQCRAGCGDLGDPELEYLCVDCHADRIEFNQQEEFRKYCLAKEEPATPAQVSSPVKKYRGPRAIDHAKALDEFLRLHREQDSDVVARELTSLKREIAFRETSKKQLRKYMIATDEELQVDSKEWTRYKVGPPNEVPTHDVEEVVELMAQLRLYCRWKRRALQKRVEARRLQLEAEQLAMKKQKKTRVKVPLLSLRTVRSSAKTAVGSGTQSSIVKKKGPLLSAWKKKIDK
ncbi:hypothetical protein DVH05_008173 [Phytophthora capsici]|nr:hypothetical protein DVH05_008173 [Phytophthora capsici]|eukprot:jgi/Phyca11/538858/estExt2_Genewise1Plus.C_PHYCAscaffold_20543